MPTSATGYSLCFLRVEFRAAGADPETVTRRSSLRAGPHPVTARVEEPVEAIRIAVRPPPARAGGPQAAARSHPRGRGPAGGRRPGAWHAGTGVAGPAARR